MSQKCPHSWGLWIGYDPMAIEFGITNGFSYYRECNNFGCNAKQKTEHLMEHGKFEEVESTLNISEEVENIRLLKEDMDSKIEERRAQARYDRGRIEALSNEPPTEGSKEYIAGYIAGRKINND